MAKITTEKQAIEALQNDAELSEIPDKLRKLESVTLAAVKQNGHNLLVAETQNAEICVAAFKNADLRGQASARVLQYVDPELRTAALLKACGIDVEEYEGTETFVPENDEDWQDANETFSVTICGKGGADWLPVAQKHLRRILEIKDEAEWDEIWLKHPQSASEYTLVFSPDKTSFEMTFYYGNSPYKTVEDFCDFLIDNFYDFSLSYTNDYDDDISLPVSVYTKRLELFIYGTCETDNSKSCEYAILVPASSEPTETKKWKVGYSEGDEFESCLSSVRKRRDLWLLGEKEKATATKKPKTKEKDWLAEVQKDGRVLKKMPEELKTAEFCLMVANKENVENWDYFLENIPKTCITPEFCKIVCEKYDRALVFLPESHKTAKICLVAVQKNGYMLKYVPDNLKTAEICLAAVQQKGNALQYVPDNRKTAEICLVAVKQSGDALYHVPETLITEEICLAAVQQNSSAFEFVPEKLKTIELCLAAVQNDGALRYVPEKHRNEEICLAAVQQDTDALEYVPEALQETIKAKLNI